MAPTDMLLIILVAFIYPVFMGMVVHYYCSLRARLLKNPADSTDLNSGAVAELDLEGDSK